MKSARRLFFLLASVCALIACAEGAPEWSANIPPPPNVSDMAGKTASSSGLATVRVIVQFNQPVAFNDPTFLKTLQDRAQARIRYIAAVSGDTHVYSLELPTNQHAAPVLNRLANLPSVARVELDQKAKAQ
jgi:hypothetical protein